MEYAPTGLLITPPLPPFPPASHGIDLSPLEFVLGLIAIITIPILIYAFIFAIRCPQVPALGRSRQRFSGEFPGVEAPAAVSEVKLRKEAEGECPVCLSAFAEGEEVKQLSACNHYFHAPCIDAWLSSHANCPVCRAWISVKRPPRSNAPPARDSDHLQGLPDASSMV
ncbi:RING-H2 finger protein ATL33 [Punica granatum]|uniref:RING-type domain-containing protein n=2 Tax=Punica granatum TaxID=22663 RepID=A0A218XC77_PUNGR|nr:RING-H2 finger protein ATL33 [Punica granatum]OWM82316.1 hypothetical protein CDL15_Pgr001890 [Punica granatum]PKI62093.1 hypothetical protein CRG98_017466 [Punica granatum]